MSIKENDNKKTKLHFIFSNGFRCNSTDFLIKYEFRKMSSPFDYLYIDFETTLKLINNKFEDYLNDIIIYDRNNKDNKILSLINEKKTNEVDPLLIDMVEKHKSIRYMHDHYGGFLLNQNYLNYDNDVNELSDNLYNWKHICIFLHHDVKDKNECDKFEMRCNRFLDIYDKYANNMALFSMTRILSNDNNTIHDEMNKIFDLKKKYNINCYTIMIMCCDQLDDTEYLNEENKCLFIIKRVPPYVCFEPYGTDCNINWGNSLNFTNQYNTILKYFDVTELKEKSEI
jgi:hypothetical protein